MKERPMLFSAPMVQAILQGKKTQTRRVAKLTDACHLKEPREHRRWHPQDPEAALACPHGQVGDQIWAKETWAAPRVCDHLKPSDIEPQQVFYAADDARVGIF